MARLPSFQSVFVPDLERSCSNEVEDGGGCGGGRAAGAAALDHHQFAPSFQCYAASEDYCSDDVMSNDAFVSPRSDPDSDFEYDLYSDCSSNRK